VLTLRRETEAARVQPLGQLVRGFGVSISNHCVENLCAGEGRVKI
jgi:hypothetical protein